MDLKNYISKILTNMPGWRTNRKIVVIESDDWGSVRMPSKEVYDILLNKGIRVDKCPYNSFDSLESESDLNALYEVLTSLKDNKGKHPVITANSVLANPNFEKIKESRFQEYHFETFVETYKRYPKHNNSFRLIQEGLKKEIFVPQFHAREHLNVSRWMSALQNNFPETHIAFENHLYGLSTNITSEKRKSFLAALDFSSKLDCIEKQKILKSGLDLFESFYGYKSVSFIAPNYTWGNDLLPILRDKGVKYIQGSHSQSIPKPNESKNYSVRHNLGEQTNFGQLYLIRNCFFEPAISPQVDSLSSCLRDVQTAFLWNKPAIISTHRVNFIGSIVEKNRKENLKSLHILLTTLMKKYPEIEFMTSNQLGNLINN